MSPEVTDPIWTALLNDPSLPDDGRIDEDAVQQDVDRLAGLEVRARDQDLAGLPRAVDIHVE